MELLSCWQFEHAHSAAGGTMLCGHPHSQAVISWVCLGLGMSHVTDSQKYTMSGCFSLSVTLADSIQILDRKSCANVPQR